MKTPKQKLTQILLTGTFILTPVFGLTEDNKPYMNPEIVKQIVLQELPFGERMTPEKLYIITDNLKKNGEYQGEGQFGMFYESSIAGQIIMGYADFNSNDKFDAKEPVLFNIMTEPGKYTFINQMNGAKKEVWKKEKKQKEDAVKDLINENIFGKKKKKQE